MSSNYGIWDEVQTIYEQANILSFAMSDLENKNKCILCMISDITKRVDALEKTTKTSAPIEGNTEQKLAAIQAILKGG